LIEEHNLRLGPNVPIAVLRGVRFLAHSTGNPSPSGALLLGGNRYRSFRRLCLERDRMRLTQSERVNTRSNKSLDHDRTPKFGSTSNDQGLSTGGWGSSLTNRCERRPAERLCGAPAAAVCDCREAPAIRPRRIASARTKLPETYEARPRITRRAGALRSEMKLARHRNEPIKLPRSCLCSTRSWLERLRCRRDPFVFR
jgi:hypothetical protein